MILLASFGVVIALVPVFGGKLSRIAQLELRAVWLLYLALAIQLVIIEVAPAGLAASDELHLATYALALLFLLANRSMPGVVLVALGALANTAAIAANGGVMPASEHALSVAGLNSPGEHFANSAAVADARLAFLGDIFAVPERFPLANVFSVGDVLLLIGGGVSVHVITGSWLARAGARRAPVPVEC